MKNIVLTAGVALACVSVSTAGFAKKPPACNIIGTWQDSYGAVATFPNEKKGTATAAVVCTGTYKLKNTTLTETTWDITGTSKNPSCPPISSALTFATGVCNLATGTITVPGFGTLPDTFTQTSTAVRHAPARNSDLTDGLK